MGRTKKNNKSGSIDILDSLEHLPDLVDKVAEKGADYGLFASPQTFHSDPARLKNFTAIELFAGAGGLSIGLEKAGFHVIIANEIMKDFADTLRTNHPATKVIQEDIHKIDFRKELKEMGHHSVDLVSGGPPCQGLQSCR